MHRAKCNSTTNLSYPAAEYHMATTSMTPRSAGTANHMTIMPSTPRSSDAEPVSCESKLSVHGRISGVLRKHLLPRQCSFNLGDPDRRPRSQLPGLEAAGLRTVRCSVDAAAAPRAPPRRSCSLSRHDITRQSIRRSTSSVADAARARLASTCGLAGRALTGRRRVDVTREDGLPGLPHGRVHSPASGPLKVTQELSESALEFGDEVDTGVSVFGLPTTLEEYDRVIGGGEPTSARLISVRNVDSSLVERDDMAIVRVKVRDSPTPSPHHNYDDQPGDGCPEEQGNYRRGPVSLQDIFQQSQRSRVRNKDDRLTGSSIVAITCSDSESCAVKSCTSVAVPCISGSYVGSPEGVVGDTSSTMDCLRPLGAMVYTGLTQGGVRCSGSSSSGVSTATEGSSAEDGGRGIEEELFACDAQQSPVVCPKKPQVTPDQSGLENIDFTMFEADSGPAVGRAGIPGTDSEDSLAASPQLRPPERGRLNALRRLVKKSKSLHIRPLPGGKPANSALLSCDVATEVSGVTLVKIRQPDTARMLDWPGCFDGFDDDVCAASPPLITWDPNFSTSLQSPARSSSVQNISRIDFKNMGQEPQRAPSTPRPSDLASSSQLFHLRSPEEAVEELAEDTAQAGGQLRHADVDNWASYPHQVSRPQPGYEPQAEPGYEPQPEPRHEPGYEPRLDSSYDKAVRTADSDSVPSTPVLGHRTQQDSSSETTTSTSRISSFFSKRSLKGNPLKRTKSVTKLERKRYAPDNEDPLPAVPTSSRLRSSRSHESLLSNHSVVSGSDVSSSCPQQQQVSVKPLHSSILGQQHCIQISSASGTRYYSCRSAEERDRWIHSLRCTVQPNRERMRRVDNSLRIWILEAKSVSQKKRYFCELYLDDTLYARTTSKHKQELCFWGEIFDFGNLPAVQTIQVHLYREADKRRKKEKNVLIGVVTIPVSAVNSRFFVEKWYPICAEKAASGKPTPSLRVKCRFQAVDILPLSAYREFLQYVSCRYRPLCEFLEPLLGVKYKEDIAAALVCIMQREGLAKHLLAELVIMDVNKVDDERLTFRGNSLATKATESFMRLVGERYLSDTLGDPIRRLLETGADLEVDPLKVSSSSALQKQRQNLRNAVQEIWNAILASYNSFPRELRDCFHMISERLKEAGKSEQRENVVSSCIFLRFFCPAILSPSLFGLVQEYPDEKCVRNLTLVAKTLQTLANFTQFQGKESYMEFLNDFIIKEAQTMKSFLRKITYNTSSREPSSVQQEWDGVVDLGKQLSLLHGFLRECVAMVTSSEHLVERQRLDAALNSVTEAQRRADGGLQHSPPPPPSTTVAPPPTSYLSLQRNLARNAVDGSRSTPTPIAGAAMLGVSSMPVPYQRRRPLLLTSSTVDAPPAADPARQEVPEKASTLPRHALLTSRPRDEYGAGVGLQQRGSVGGHQHQPHFHSHQTPTYPATGTRGRPTAESTEQDASGSQMSISQLSTVASSGYQSFAASYSQSSSPVDPVIGRSKVSRCSPPGPRIHRRQDVGTAHQHPPLAFNNPMYQLNSNKGTRPSKSASLSSTQSMDDVQLTLAPSIPCRLLPRSSSSSPSPPRERRVTAPPRITPRAAPPPPPVEPPADALARTRRLKASRRTSADILSARRQQLRDSDTDSSPELRTARAKNKNRRSRLPDKTFDEYEEEIRALQCQMEQLQSRLDEDIRPAASAQQQHQCLNSGAPINEILNRLSVVEGELRREQGQMTCVLSEKERVILAQSRRIQELNVANSRLHTALATLQDRTPVPTAAAAPLTGTAAGTAVSDTSDYKSSSC